MKPISLILPLLLTGLLLPACTPQQPDMAALKKTVEDYNNLSIQSMMTGQTDSLMAYHTDDAMQLPPNDPAIVGKEALLANMKKSEESGVKVTSASFKTTELKAGGSIAYEIGTYDMEMDIPNMGSTKEVGKYIAIWQQQEDGSWKVHAEIWNSDNPPAMPEKEKGKK